MVIKQGTPTIVTAGSVGLGQAVAELVPGSIGMSNVVGNILRNFEDPAAVVIDPQTGKVYASSVDARVLQLIDAPREDANLIRLIPDAGQTGRSLAFSLEAGASLDMDMADLVTAVKPKLSVESLVSRLLAKIQAYEAANPTEVGKFFITIDQVNKQITVTKADGTDAATLRTNLDAIVLNVAESVKATLTPAATDVVADALPFEGGAV